MHRTSVRLAVRQRRPVVHHVHGARHEGRGQTASNGAAQLLSDGDLLTDVADLDVPACVICGGADSITPPAQAREVARAFPAGCEYREIAGAGHACYIEAPTEFNQEVRAFAETLA